MQVVLLLVFLPYRSPPNNCHLTIRTLAWRRAGSRCKIATDNEKWSGGEGGGSRVDVVVARFQGISGEMLLQDVLCRFPVPEGYADHLNKCKLFQIDGLTSINTLVDASTWSIYQLPDQVASWLLRALLTLGPGMQGQSTLLRVSVYVDHSSRMN